MSCNLNVIVILAIKIILLFYSYIGPVSVFGFFIVATVINKLLMDPVAKWTYKQEKFEGDFR